MSNIIKSREDSIKRIKEMFDVPEHIMKFINEKTEHTDKINRGIDKEAFRLGMLAMYFHLKKDPNLK